MIKNYCSFKNNESYDLDKILFLYSSFYRLNQLIKNEAPENMEIFRVLTQLKEILKTVIESKDIMMRSLCINMDKLEYNINYYLNQYKSKNEIIEEYSYILNFTDGLRGMIDASFNGMKLMKHYKLYNLSSIVDRLSKLDEKLEELHKYTE